MSFNLMNNNINKLRSNYTYIHNLNAYDSGDTHIMKIISSSDL